MKAMNKDKQLKLSFEIIIKQNELISLLTSEIEKMKSNNNLSETEERDKSCINKLLNELVANQDIELKTPQEKVSDYLVKNLGKGECCFYSIKDLIEKLSKSMDAKDIRFLATLLDKEKEIIFFVGKFIKGEKKQLEIFIDSLKNKSETKKQVSDEKELSEIPEVSKEQKSNFRKSNWITLEEALKFAVETKRKGYLKCKDCGNEYTRDKFNTHYRIHLNDKQRNIKVENEKSEDTMPKISDWHKERYKWNAKTKKFCCLICKQHFKVNGTGTHWWGHLNKKETTLPCQNARKENNHE